MFEKGYTPWNKGLRGDKRCGWKGGKPKCEKCGKEITYTYKICLTCYNKARAGEKNYLWKGGITPLLTQIRKCYKYKQWRKQVWLRDNFTCQKCLKTKCYVESHHIQSFSKILKKYQIKTLEESLGCEELWLLDNGITYCKECHKLTDNYGNKINKKRKNPFSREEAGIIGEVAERTKRIFF